MEKHRGKLFYYGPVYGEKKTEFFSNLDVFLFPTKHKLETEGLVTLEALSSGIPVIATNLGCLTDNLKESGSLTTNISSYRDTAFTYIKEINEDRELLARRKRKALERFNYLKQLNARKKEELLEFMAS